jgi:hypothetical protein
MDAFDNLLEKDETKKLEQDFVNSDPEEQAWKPLPPTFLFKENSLSLNLPQRSPNSSVYSSHFLTFSFFLTTYYSNIERTSSYRHHISHSPDRKPNVLWRFTGRQNGFGEN